MKLIPLSQRSKTCKGVYFAKVSNKDYIRVRQFLWSKHRIGNNMYATRHEKVNGKYTVIYLHRFIVGVTDRKIEVDHKDFDGLNCQRKNLRIATHQQNNFNKKKEAGFSSIYKGITWNKQLMKWKAAIGFNYKTIHIGVFKNELEAFNAYKEKAKELQGQFFHAERRGIKPPYNQ